MKRLKRDKVPMLVPEHLRGKNGRPKKRTGIGPIGHVPNNRTRRRVRNLSAVGYSIEAIADCLGIVRDTLLKHYQKEFKFATMVMLANCRSGLAKAISKKEPWAIKYTLDRKGRDFGWAPRTELTGKDGAPLMNLSNLTDEELDALERLQSKAISHS